MWASPSGFLLTVSSTLPAATAGPGGGDTGPSLPSALLWLHQLPAYLPSGLFLWILDTPSVWTWCEGPVAMCVNFLLGLATIFQE